jgi:hypothetical protein
MRTILAMALAANIFFSAGANYLQGAFASQLASVSANTASTVASTTTQPAEQSAAF